jgi:GNAT superfamily N-acetyltransferase
MGDSFDIRPFDILDEAQRGTAEEWVAVFVAVQRELFGDRGSAWTVAEMQAMQRKTDKKRITLAAWSGGRVVGASTVLLPMVDNGKLAMTWPMVLAEHRGRGVGTAFVEVFERVAREHGRTTLVSESEWAAGGVDVAERFAQRRGYVIAQTTLRSEMRLPADAAALRTIIDGPGAEDYVIENYVDDLPESWLEDRAVLRQRMSTDAPKDDLDVEEEDWDADRLRAEHAATRSAGLRVVESAARHVASGRLVAITRVEVSPIQPNLGYQQDTLVLREHRGHHLGVRLKAANALLLMDTLPAVRSVRTWNASSNAHMLAVNQALGYAVDGYTRLWQKVLA